MTYHREGNMVYVGDLDYVKFRLFQLSILWRAGISSFPFFENIRLGVHAERIRRLLYTGDPGIYTRYGCVMFGIKFQDTVFTDLIMQPGRLKLMGHTAYRFVFGGLMWVFIVSSHDVAPPLSQVILQPSGNALLIIRDALDMPALARFSKELVRMGRHQ